MEPDAEEAEREAKEALLASKLAPGYFQADFDAVADALAVLPSDPTATYLEDRVSEFMITLKLLNESLFSSIMENYSDFVGGIERVTEVERDLQVAHVLAKNSRRSLAMCSEEVKRNIRIASSAKRKRELFNLLEMLLQVKGVADQVGHLEQGLEDGRLAWTVSSTLQCAEVISQLDPEIFCIHDLRSSVMRILDDTLASTDDTLQALCFNFDPETSSRVFEVYLTLGDTTGLADKIQACFAQAVLGSSHGIIRTFAGVKSGKGKGGTQEQQMNSFRNRPYNELCKTLSIDQFRACLLKTFDVLVGVMISHYQMRQWYAEELTKYQGRASGDDGGESEASSAIEVIGVIQKALNDGRKLLFEHIEGRIASLLNAPSAGEGEHFLQVLEWTHCFISCGEAFCENKVTNLRKHIARTCARFFDAYHRQNMEALKAILDKELWHSFPLDEGSIKPLKQVIKSEVGVNTFGALQFEVLASLRDKLFAEGTDPVATFRDLSTKTESRSREGSENEAKEASETSSVYTSSSIKILKCMERYIYLMKVIGENSSKVVEGFCQLFDLYFWHIFQLFGNVDLLYDKSAPQDGSGALTLRLKKTLHRISQSISYTIGQYVDGYPSDDPGQGQGQQNVLSSGNMYGLRERTVALSSLGHIASEILSSSSDLQALVPDALTAQLDSFQNRTVMAVEDLREHLFHRVAKLLVNLVWVPEEIEKCQWAIKDVGMQQHEWVDRLNGQFYQFQLKLDAVGVQGDALKEFWKYAVSAANESILEGFSRVKKCSIEGRAAMSLDLQMFTTGMKRFVPKGFEPDVRIVDGYIKAFYVPESDLLHWAMTHREYKPQAILRLVSCILDANKPSSLNPLEINKRKKRVKELLAEIESSLI
ncbi:hypothetical protein HOP50_08g51230 [Chloropicon primus]|nr:hypothetical protein HOP50_08g51230 [Chloropicon primus]